MREKERQRDRERERETERERARVRARARARGRAIYRERQMERHQRPIKPAEAGVIFVGGGKGIVSILRNWQTN